MAIYFRVTSPDLNVLVLQKSILMQAQPSVCVTQVFNNDLQINSCTDDRKTSL